MTMLDRARGSRRFGKFRDGAVLFGAGMVSGYLGSASLRESCQTFWTDPACVAEPGPGAALKAFAAMAALLFAVAMTHRVSRGSDEMIQMIDLKGWRLSAWIAIGVLALVGVLEIAIPGLDVPTLVLALVLLLGQAVGRTLVGWQYGATGD